MGKQTVGYARANDAGDLPKYVAELTEAGCAAIYTDCIGGNTIDRPGLNDALDRLKPGDTLMVPDIDRLARGMHTYNTLTAELNRRGIELLFLDDGGDKAPDSPNIRAARQSL